MKPVFVRLGPARLARLSALQKRQPSVRIGGQVLIPAYEQDGRVTSVPNFVLFEDLRSFEIVDRGVSDVYFGSSVDMSLFFEWLQARELKELPEAAETAYCFLMSQDEVRIGDLAYFMSTAEHLDRQRVDLFSCVVYDSSVDRNCLFGKRAVLVSEVAAPDLTGRKVLFLGESSSIRILAFELSQLNRKSSRVCASSQSILPAEAREQTAERRVLPGNCQISARAKRFLLRNPDFLM